MVIAAMGIALVAMLPSISRAEVLEVRFARQLGIGYLQLYIMQQQGLVEKHAKAAGLEIATRYVPLGTPTAITDALLSGSVDIVGIGLPSFLTMWDRTQSNLKVRGIIALNRQPAYLLTRKEGIASLKDYGPTDRIALPAPKVSVQAIMLQMIAERQLGVGRHDALDHLTFGMSHPDGTTAMLSGHSEITSHFTSAPFQYQQLDGSKSIRKLLSSYDATDGPNTFSVAATTAQWREANPKIYAEIFLAIENIKLTPAYIEKMITDPEFSFDPAPMNVLKIEHFMNRIGSLKSKPGSWTEMFHPEAHRLHGS